jgi:hypothetical protein
LEEIKKKKKQFYINEVKNLSTSKDKKNEATTNSSKSRVSRNYTDSDRLNQSSQREKDQDQMKTYNKYTSINNKIKPSKSFKKKKVKQHKIKFKLN